MKTAPGEVHGTVVVPAPVIKALGKYVQEVQKMISRKIMNAQPELLDDEVEVF